MLTCRDMTELVGDYVEGRLSLWDQVRFQMHLGMCRNCRAYVRQMKLTQATLGRLPEAPMPPDVREEMLARFHRWKAGEDVAPTDPSEDPDGAT